MLQRLKQTAVQQLTNISDGNYLISNDRIKNIFGCYGMAELSDQTRRVCVISMINAMTNTHELIRFTAKIRGPNFDEIPPVLISAITSFEPIADTIKNKIICKAFNNTYNSNHGLRSHPIDLKIIGGRQNNLCGRSHIEDNLCVLNKKDLAETFKGTFGCAREFRSIEFDCGIIRSSQQYKRFFNPCHFNLVTVSTNNYDTLDPSSVNVVAKLVEQMKMERLVIVVNEDHIAEVEEENKKSDIDTIINISDSLLEIVNRAPKIDMLHFVAEYEWLLPVLPTINYNNIQKCAEELYFCEWIVKWDTLRNIIQRTKGVRQITFAGCLIEYRKGKDTVIDVPKGVSVCAEERDDTRWLIGLQNNGKMLKKSKKYSWI